MHNAARSIFGFSHAGLVPDFSRIQHLVLYGRNIVESLMVKEVKAFMAALARGMRCTYIDPRASATAAKSTRFWQVRPNSDYALNLALIHEVLRQKAYDEDFVERCVTGMDVLREAVKDTTPEWQEPHTGVPARELREFVAEIAGQAPQRGLQPGLDDGAPQAVVLRQPHGADPQRADGQPGDAGRLHHRQAAGVLRPQEPQIPGRARAGGDRAARGRCRHHAPDLGPGDRHAAPVVRGDGNRAALRHRRLHRLPPRPAHRDARRRGGQAARWTRLELLVSIDVRYSETGWYSDVILPESTYLERANILAQLPGPVPVFAMRDQAIAPRFDSRPAWWIFREILRRMGKMEALDFETIEEIWNYQLEGTGVTVADMREAGIVRPGRRAAAGHARRAQVLHAVGQDRDRQRADEAGRPAFLPPYEPNTAPSGDRFTLLFGRPPTLAHGQSLNNPLLREIAPEQVLWIHPERAAPLGIRDGDGSRSAAAAATSDGCEPRSRKWIHREAVFMLHGYGATVPLATRALGVGVADQRLQHGKLYEFDPAGARQCADRDHRPRPACGPARSFNMSIYALRHDEASCIGCQACEVHCKSNKGLGPGPSPCKIISTGPIDVGGVPRVRHTFMPCFHCEEAWCVKACPTGAMKKREKDGIVHVQAALCVGCKSCITACPWGTPQWDPAHEQGGQVRLLHGPRRRRPATGLRDQVRHRLPVLRPGQRSARPAPRALRALHARRTRGPQVKERP